MKARDVRVIEKWKIIKEFPAYHISNMGNIMSYIEDVPKILKGNTDSKGYRKIRLYNKNIQNTFSIYRLVAHAFIGKIPRGHEVNHIDGIKSNNNIKNLEYVTRSENIVHAMKIGLYPWNSGSKFECGNPKCKKIFLRIKSRVRSKINYCSHKCQGLHNSNLQYRSPTKDGK